MSEHSGDRADLDRMAVTDELRTAFCENLAEYLQGHHPDLYPTQREVLHDILLTAERTDGGYVQLPSGAGKTVIFSELIKATELKTLVVVPTRQLVDQTAKAFEERGISSVRRVSPYQREDMGAQVSIATYVGVLKSTTPPENHLLLDPKTYGLVVLDEAHHANSPGMKNALPKFKGAYRFGFTASPDYSADRKLSDVLPEVIHSKTIAESIKLGLVSPYTNLLLYVDGDMSGVGIVNGDYETHGLRHAINVQARNETVARVYAENLSDKKAFFSCADIEHAQAMAETLRAQGVAAESVHSKLPKDVLAATLDGYAAGRVRAVTCVDMLTEGFDDQSIEVVINVSPTLSFIKQTQRSGRALRVDRQNPGKHALIIDCIDYGYRQFPVLFCNPEVAGAAQILPSSGLSKFAEATLTRLFAYAKANHVPITDAGYMAKVEATKPRNTPRVSHAELVGRLGLKPPALDWGQEAACNEFGQAFVDMAFYPERETGSGGVTAIAKYICSKCAVIGDCLPFSLATPEQVGTRAGLTAHQRRGILSLLRSGVDPADVNAEIERMQLNGAAEAHQRYMKPGLGF